MAQIILGKTGITTDENGFGALPIQRVTRDEAAYLLKKAFDHGITYFDTARFYTDSEEKIGFALRGVRHKVVIATKTMSAGAEGFWEQLHTSLGYLKTDYIDVHQFHNPPFCPKPGDGSGLYEAMLEAKAQGKVRHIGLTSHKLPVALEAAESGLYAVIQFPFSYLAAPQDVALAARCRELGVGFVAMKALSGGLITQAAAAWAFIRQHDNVLPIWGIQRETELDEFISFSRNPPVLDGALLAAIEADRAALSGAFCRGCGYCLPCPADIDIPTCARMSLLLRRAPADIYLSGEWQAKMERIRQCLHCGHCQAHCPYGLDTPALLKENLADYQTYV